MQIGNLETQDLLGLAVIMKMFAPLAGINEKEVDETIKNCLKELGVKDV